MPINRRELLKYAAGGLVAGASLAKGSVGEQVQIAQQSDAEAGKSIIRLDRNENPYGASEFALAVLREAGNKIAKYPDDGASLRETIAQKQGIRADEILLGSGSSEILRMAVDTFLGPSKELVIATPTLGLPATLAKKRNATVVEVPLKKDHSHDLTAILAKINARTGLIYVCNPNNPTATLTERQDLEGFLAKVPKRVPVLMDEAYHEYAGESGSYKSFLGQAPEAQNLIVTRTFSKAYGMAGLRIGYGVGAAELINKISGDKLQFGVNALALAAATAAYTDSRHLENCVQNNDNDRQEFLNQVNARMMRAFDSHTNFVCMNVMRPANEIVERFRQHDVWLPSSFPLLPNYMRVSLGSPAEMRVFWRTWDQMGMHPMAM